MSLKGNYTYLYVQSPSHNGKAKVFLQEIPFASIGAPQALYLLSLSLMQDLLGYSGLLASLTHGLFICSFASAAHAVYKYV